MFLIGLTGGIAAGKSTVAKLWRELGAVEIDSDEVAREVVAPGSIGLEAVVDAFGPALLTERGELNRKALGEIVFQDAAKRKSLESILHPLIQQRSRERIAANSAAELVVYSIPLLVETASTLPFDAVVTVETSPEEQLRRLVEVRGMSASEARMRIQSQATREARVQRADFVLDSSKSLAELREDARALFATLRAAAQAKSRH